MPFHRQAIIWTNDDLGHWHIYVSLGLNELNKHYVYDDSNAHHLHSLPPDIHICVWQSLMTWLIYFNLLKPKSLMMAFLLSLVEPQVVIMTMFGVTNDWS